MKRFLLIVILLAAAALFVFSGKDVYSISDNNHELKDRCAACHLVVPGQGEGPGMFTRDVDALCLDCHEAIKNFSHPVDVLPSMLLPEGFPPGWGGTVACVTCHSIHEFESGESSLRGSPGRVFCANCHGGLESKTHCTAIGMAHLATLQSDRFVMKQVSVDALSLKCLSCHDSELGTDAEVESEASTRKNHEANQIGQSHPIGVSYFEAKRLYRGAYRDVDKLPPEIHLFGGVIGCGTCHDPYSRRRYELVMSNEVSALCLACHVK